MFINKISNTKRDTFNQCRLKYRYRYIDRLPEVGSNTDALHFGSYIHKIFEDGVDMDSAESLHALAESLKGRYKFGSSYEPKIKICIDNFIKFNSQLETKDMTETVFDVEIKDGITQTGIIDRVIRGKDGGFLIIDYKTSKREKTKFDLYNDAQLMGYAFAAHKLFKCKLEDIVCAHYYPLTNNFVTIKYTGSQIAKYLEKLVNEVWIIRKLKKTEFCAEQNQFCNWCGYKPYCPLFESGSIVENRVKNAKEAKKAKKKTN